MIYFFNFNEIFFYQNFYFLLSFIKKKKNKYKNQYTQSESYIITVSAPIRFNPTPPALVDIRNRNISGFVLKF